MKTKKQIKYLFELDSKVTVYVPSTFNVSVETDNNEQVKHVLRELSIMFPQTHTVAGFVTMVVLLLSPLHSYMRLQQARFLTKTWRKL